MEHYEIGDILTGCVTGIEEYGIFVNIDDSYSGLIHISEISSKFVQNISDYVDVGEKIKVRVIGVNDDKHHLKLSIKNLDYRIKKRRSSIIKETVHGFNTLKENMPIWIEEKLIEIKKNEQNNYKSIDKHDIN